MRSAYIKDIFREVTRSFGRFILLLVISALGSSFYVGVLSASADMRLLGDSYYKDSNLFDIHLQSTYGFDSGDLDAVRNTTGVEAVMPSYSADVLVKTDTDAYVVKTYAIPAAQGSEPLNNVTLIAGRLPGVHNEALVEQRFLDHTGLSLGDMFEITLDDEAKLEAQFNNSKFYITGVITSPLYITFRRGSSLVGSGKVDSCVYLPEQAYAFEVYTDLWVRMAGFQSLGSFSDEYQALCGVNTQRLKLTAKLRESERLQTVTLDAQSELDEQRRELLVSRARRETSLLDGERELNEAHAELMDKKALLDNSAQQLNAARLELSLSRTEAFAAIDAAEAELYASERGLIASGQKLAEARRLLSDGYGELAARSKELDAARNALEALLPDISSLRTFIELSGGSPAAEAQLHALEAIYAQRTAELADGLALLLAAEAGLDSRGRELDASQIRLDEGSAEVLKGKEQLRAQRTAAETSLSGAELELETRAQSFDTLYDEWQKAYTGYLAGSEAFAAERESSAKAISDALELIDKAEQDIRELDEPKWRINGRNDTLDFGDFKNNAERLEAIGRVFPVIFFLVAALVGLTSMTRMVDERRQQIGILKALGYSDHAIMAKFLLYALAASGIGSVGGFLFGEVFFPKAIWSAYSMLYHMPPIPTPIDPGLSAFAVFVCVSVILFATVWSVEGDLRQTPADLMRPKPPAKGRRILLENVGIIWRHMQFSLKVTSRNLFRYKKRLLMTIIGIAGCTSLLMTGFGLRDSIADIAPLQFKQLALYNAQVFFDGEGDASDIAELTEELSSNQHVEDCVYALQETYTASAPEEQVSAKPKNEQEVTLFVPENSKKLSNFIVFRDRRTHREIRLTDDGVLLSEKLASLIGAERGDMIVLTDGDGNSVPAIVDGILENYINHYVFLSRGLYSRIEDREFLPNSALLDVDLPIGREAELSERLMELSTVLNVTFTSDIADTVNDMLDSLDIVIWILIFSAGALAFVVLLNLTSINISERERELATLKVLGFFPGELSAYIYRENIVMTFLGILVGLFLGLLLHGFIITTVEIDMVMFSRVIAPMSYVYSVLLTVFFAVIVNAIMNIRLDRINMVEALKSVE